MVIEDLQKRIERLQGSALELFDDHRQAILLMGFMSLVDDLVALVGILIRANQLLTPKEPPEFQNPKRPVVDTASNAKFYLDVVNLAGVVAFECATVEDAHSLAKGVVALAYRIYHCDTGEDIFDNGFDFVATHWHLGAYEGERDEPSN